MTKDILDLLAVKHSKDLFIPECKTGPTWGGAPMRLDAWAMKRSWVSPCFYGYEIKVSRPDFQVDDKWPAYMGQCNRFSFVCPYGMIVPEEVASGVGLIWASRTGVRLFTKRKAAYRNIPFPESLVTYVLMSRVRETSVAPTSSAENVAYWRKWLADKLGRQELGYRVSRGVRDRLKSRIGNVESENRRLRSENETFAETRRILEELEVSMGSRWDVRRRIELAVKELQGGRLIGDLERVIASATVARDAIAKGAS